MHVPSLTPPLSPKGSCSAEWENRTMNEIIMRLKSGREFRFKCEEYTIKTYELNGMLLEFSYKGGVGECPIYFQREDIECIAIIGKEKNNDKTRSNRSFK